MRRTSARQCELPLNDPISIRRLICRQCGKRGVTVVQVSWGQNGAIERCWCSIDCAQKDGWPWLEPEHTVRRHD